MPESPPAEKKVYMRVRNVQECVGGVERFKGTEVQIAVFRTRNERAAAAGYCKNPQRKLNSHACSLL